LVHSLTFHVLSGVGRKTARFETDDIRDVQLVEHFTRTQNLKIMGRGVTRKTHVLSALSHNFMRDGGGDPVGAESAQGQIVAVFDKFFDRFLDGHDLALQLAIFLPENSSGLIRIRICKNLANSLI
jgi:hypothetical protein